MLILLSQGCHMNAITASLEYKCCQTQTSANHLTNSLMTCPDFCHGDA